MLLRGGRPRIPPLPAARCPLPGTARGSRRLPCTGVVRARGSSTAERLLITVPHAGLRCRGSQLKKTEDICIEVRGSAS